MLADRALLLDKLWATVASEQTTLSRVSRFESNEQRSASVCVDLHTISFPSRAAGRRQPEISLRCG